MPAHNGRFARNSRPFQAFPEPAAALREHLAIIGDEARRRDPDRHTECLREVSEEIEHLEQCLPSTLDPQLRHCLQRRSYVKALELLGGIDGAVSGKPA